ncbi:hypothetical protein B9Z47_05450 [Limnohabitans sp. 2KL-1]|uniref:DUF1963 domain-containing protein n=1 Tax=Limnohabitans sp. 2KL-1 TaxID=1100699 RepID=UPI000D3796E8|nr:DUF1963 domain-containing protein [Limnohabitans sp. 2KL-1]PUE48961.1 hypothetical protein B9Z47_05450 [Limnohabitans sp. 2KL-1]
MNSINERLNRFLPLDEPGTQEFLAMFAENQSDEGLGNFIRDYESQSRIFSVPVLEAFDINQRKDDLFFGGIPFTSEKWPWPLNSKGHRLYPIAQIDLKNASEIILFNFGSGKLQIWGEYRGNCYKGFEKNFDKKINSEDWRLRFSDDFKFIFRVISEGDLLDQVLPEVSKEIDSIGDKLFYKYSQIIGLDEGFNKLNWQSQGEMFYPNFEKFFYFGEVSNKKDKKSSIKVSECYQDLEEEFYLALDKELNDSDVMSADRLWRKIGPVCTLGGYPPSLYHNTFSYDSKIFLFFKCKGDFAVTFKKDSKGILNFSLDSHYDDVD